MGIWDVAIEFALHIETGGDPNGGYTNDPADAGGETRWGISKRAHPDVDVQNLTQRGALAIYREQYWDALQCDMLPPPVALAVFDFAVNSGVPRAARALQRSVGAKPDGIVGPNTLRAVRFGRAFELAEAINQRRMARYVAIVRARPDQIRFLRGWAARVVSLTALVGRT